MSSREIIFSAAGAGAPPTYIEDVFSTWLYTGTSANQTITNGIDLAGKGGMVWIKDRLGGANTLTDTVRGAGNYLVSNSTSANINNTSTLTSFNSNGFSLGSDSSNSFNLTGDPLVSWTFRKQPKFFDVVTWTGNGSTPRTITHSLGSTPGMIIFKRLDIVQSWWVFHQSAPGGFNGYGSLNNTSAWVASGSGIGSVGLTSFTITDPYYNGSGSSWVAYLFAHNAGGFGTSGTDNVISCGSFTASSAVTDINLGYEPQWILIKRSDSAAGPVGWYIYDSMRGMPVDLGTSAGLQPNTANAEAVTGSFGPAPTATGFQYLDALTTPATFIYMAIRRGPMKTPTSGTSVFSPITSSATVGTQLTTNFPIDSQWINYRTGATENTAFNDRLRGNSSTTTSSGNILISSSTAAEGSITSTRNWDNTGFQIPTYYSGGSTIYWNFRRAPGFFDVVCYTGTGTGTVNHNLGVAPELIIVKNRSTAGYDWKTLITASSGTLNVNDTSALDTASTQYYFGNGSSYVAPTSTVFSVYNNYNVGASGENYVAYLFATVAGVSKVGSYTGTGSTLNINAGLPTGARFVLIKRTDSTGDWWVWDTARGMVAGTDPRLALNSTAAETNANWVYTTTNGFQIVTTDATVNASGGSYIYLAIA